MAKNVHLGDTYKTSAKFLRFWTPLPPSSAFHATYQNCSSAKSANSLTPLPPQCGHILSIAPLNKLNMTFCSRRPAMRFYECVKHEDMMFENPFQFSIHELIQSFHKTRSYDTSDSWSHLFYSDCPDFRAVMLA